MVPTLVILGVATGTYWMKQRRLKEHFLLILSERDIIEESAGKESMVSLLSRDSLNNKEESSPDSPTTAENFSTTDNETSSAKDIRKRQNVKIIPIEEGSPKGQVSSTAATPSIKLSTFSATEWQAGVVPAAFAYLFLTFFDRVSIGEPTVVSGDSANGTTEFLSVSLKGTNGSLARLDEAPSALN